MTPRVTYKGANAHNPQKVIIVQGTNARSRADLMAKISQILSILRFIVSTSMLGGAYFGYKYVTSPQLKNRVMNEILLNVQQMMPKILDNEIPKVTGESIPLSTKALGN